MRVMQKVEDYAKKNVALCLTPPVPAPKRAGDGRLDLLPFKLLSLGRGFGVRYP